MSKIKLDWAMCLDCEWEGDIEECEIDSDYDDFWGRDYEYHICPKCSGAVELTNKQLGDFYTDEELEEYDKNNKTDE